MNLISTRSKSFSHVPKTSLPTSKSSSEGTGASASFETPAEKIDIDFSPLESDDKKVSSWATLRPVEKLALTGVTAVVGGMLGGFPLSAGLAISPIAGVGLAAAAGVVLMQGVQRLKKSDTTRSELEASKQKKALEKNVWQSSTILKKAGSLSLGGVVGASVLGAGLALGGMAGPAALATGAGMGVAGAAALMLISKESDDLGTLTGPSDSSGDIGLMMSPDGQIGLGISL